MTHGVTHSIPDGDQRKCDTTATGPFHNHAHQMKLHHMTQPPSNKTSLYAATQRLLAVATSITVTFVVCCAVATRVDADTWTSLRGTKSIEAEMVGLWGDQLILALPDGRRVTVSISDLRAESRIQAQRLADSNVQSRAARINVLKAQAELAASAAPDPLPQPPPANPIATIEPAAEVAARFKAIDTQLRAGHAIAIFDALPPKYRHDLEELAKLAAAKTSGITWRSIVTAAQQLGDLIVTRQNWFFSHPRFDASISDTPEETKRFNDTLLALAGMLRSAIDRDGFELSAIGTTPLRQWLLQRDAAVAPYLAEVFRINQVSQAEFAAEKGGRKGNAATLTITTHPGAGAADPVVKTVPMTKIDDVLVPTSIAEAWKNQIPDIKQNLEAAEDGTVLSDPTSVVLLSTIRPILDSLAQAQNRGEFHAAMQPLIEAATPWLETLQSDFSRRR